MGKFSNHKRLTKKEQDELFIDFAKALSTLHGATEIANFIKDLFSHQEVLMLARRLQIASLLNDGLSYEEIRRFNKASFGTIARVQTWLQLYGEGYRMVLKRTKQNSKTPSEVSMDLHKFKKKHQMYFWPELLLKEIVRAANAREKQRLLNVVNSMREKTKLSKDLLQLLQ